jgi:hypothetical protein
MKERHRKNKTAGKTPSGFPEADIGISLKSKILSGIALCALIFLPLVTAQETGYIKETDYLEFFSNPAHIWGNGVERTIEEAYRNCFITRIIDGKIINIRMPFGENNERGGLLNRLGHNILEGGKGNPATLWPVINRILDSDQFTEYVQTISDGKEKVIIFDISTRSWRSSLNFYDIARMKAGSYRGLHHRPYVLVSGHGIEETDIYNYLYCVGLVGMDCSGFVWYVLSYIARQGGLNLDRLLSPYFFGTLRDANASWYVGTSLYSSENRYFTPVEDEIANLRPADVMLFMGPEGRITHSAIIQSVDFTNGVIRYLQCTDEAPFYERGVHESFVYFDPARPRTSLSDYSIKWSQERLAAFPGEAGSVFKNDGERYRAHAVFGGGRIVRMIPLQPVIQKLNRR